MSMSTTTTDQQKPSTNTHPEYDQTIEQIETVRDCIKGAPTIKKKGYTYLPHPSQIDTTSQEQQVRYREFKAGAEFDSYPDDTRRELLGKMRINDTVVEVPDSLEYLITNADGNGVPLNASIEFAVNNVYQTKWHALVVDYINAPSSNETLSRAEAMALNPRSVIVQYTRENIINWNFSTVDGVMQLSFIQFMELYYEFDAGTGVNEEKQRYLVLALDEEGNYYQAKYEQGETLAQAERDYITINGSAVKRLPVIIVADEELQNDCFPIQTGYLYGVCDATLSRYRVSAAYKETQRNMAPTIFTSGWKQGDIDIFKEANNNRSYVATGAGAVNNMPEGVESQILSSSPEMEDYHWYFADNEKKIRMMGGSVSNQAVAMTATEAEIAASKQNALMNTVADNSEDSFEKAIFWCGVFEGIYQLDDFNTVEDIVVDMPRDFATPKLTTEEVGKYQEMVVNGLITQDTYLQILEKGGWIDDAETAGVDEG